MPEIVKTGRQLAQVVNDIEWEQWRKARAQGLKAEEPATLRHPDADLFVAIAKLEADQYRAISLAYAGLA